MDFFNQSIHWFVARVLRNQFALDGELEDGLAQVGDGFGAVVENLEVVAQTLPRTL